MQGRLKAMVLVQDMLLLYNQRFNRGERASNNGYDKARDNHADSSLLAIGGRS